MQQGYGAGMPPSMMDNGMMPPVMGGMGGGYNPGMVAPQGFDPSMMNSGGGYTQPPFPNPNASNNFSVDPAQGNDNSNDNVNMVGDMSSTNPVDQTDPNANSVDPNASDSVVQDSGSQDSGVQDSASQNDSSQDPNAQDPNASPEELATDPSQQDPNAANFSSAPAPVTGTSNAFGDAAAQAAGDTGALSENITQILQDPATHIDFVSSFTDPQYQSAVRTPLETAGVTLGASSDKTSLVANVGGTAIPLQLTPDQANQALTQMKSTGAYQIEFDRIQAIQVLMQQSSVGN
jgi:hypothetical protein